MTAGSVSRPHASRTSRQSRVIDLLRTHDVRSQGELLTLLSADGIDVTQATLSRDLVEVGAVRIRRGRTLVYAVPDPGGSVPPSATADDLPARLRRVCEELLVSAHRTGNQVVLRTPPGAANYLASTIDQSHLCDVLGTIAGDDTILVITKDVAAGRELVRLLDPSAAGRPDRPRGRGTSTRSTATRSSGR